MSTSGNATRTTALIAVVTGTMVAAVGAVLPPGASVAADRSVSGAAASVVVRTVQPSAGSTVGRQRVLVTGRGFRGVRRVTFGGVSGVNLRVLSARRLVVTAPAHAPRRVVVRVVTSHGTATTGRYRYVRPGPSRFRWSGSVQPGTGGQPLVSPATQLSCAGGGLCVAVGNPTVQDDPPAVLMLRSGSWTQQQLPLPSGAAPGSVPTLNDVGCASSTFCVVVGSYGPASGGASGYVATWDGTAWTADSVAAPSGAAGNAELNAVDCPAPGKCVADGTVSNATSSRWFVATLTAGGWQSETLPLPPYDVVHAAATHVDCPGATTSACVLVGRFYARGSGSSPAVGGASMFATHRNGGWSVVAAPAPPGLTVTATRPVVFGISCPASGRCVAVGSYDDARSNDHGLVEHLFGGRWRAVAVSEPPDSTGERTFLTGVSCPAAGTCVEVGRFATAAVRGHPQGDRGLVLRQHAGRSTRQEAPLQAGVGSGETDAVSCPSVTRCTAIGLQATARESHALVETYAGGVWSPSSLGPHANRPTPLSASFDIDCPSVGSCGALSPRYDSEDGTADGGGFVYALAR